MKHLKLIAMLLCLSFSNAQTSTDIIKKSISVDPATQHTFYIENVFGAITVEGYNGSTIEIEVTKTITARNKELLEKGKQEVKVGTGQKGNKIYAYLDSPYSHFSLEDGDFHYRNSARGDFHHNNENFSYHSSKSEREKYDHRLDYKVKVPKNTNIDVRTVLEGDIVIKNIDAEFIESRNIHGSITLQNVSGQTDVNTINNDINITYSKNPTKESWYKTINGEINVVFKNNLNALMSYKTINGDFYTNFDIKETAPVIEKSKTHNGSKTKFKVNSQRLMKVGNGSVRLHFDQINGETTVKK